MGSGSRARTCRACCAACGRHFSSTEAFDLHRQGPYSDRRCQDPAQIEGLAVWSDSGRCDVTAGCGGPVVVFTAARSLAAAARLNGLSRVGG